MLQKSTLLQKNVNVKKKILRLKRNQKADGGLIDEGLAV